MSGRVGIAFLMAAVILGGCRGALRKPLPICAGKTSAGEAIAALGSQAEKAAPMKATGTCRLEYYIEDKRKPEKEAFPVRLWMNPPSEISLHGDVAFDPRGVILGANRDEFWLAIRPKISSYWRGRWSDGDKVQTLILNPRIVLEAVGIVALGGDEPERGDWSLTNKGPYDILTRRDEEGLISKRIYVCSCDYLVRKIEYYDEFGRVAVAAELDDYEEAAEGFKVPKYIKVVKRGMGGRDDSVRINLKSVKPMSFNEKQLEALFQPQPGRFEHVYEIVNGEWVEQPH
jgi:hypothetical protein